MWYDWKLQNSFANKTFLRDCFGSLLWIFNSIFHPLMKNTWHDQKPQNSSLMNLAVKHFYFSLIRVIWQMLLLNIKCGAAARTFGTPHIASHAKSSLVTLFSQCVCVCKCVYVRVRDFDPRVWRVNSCRAICHRYWAAKERDLRGMIKRLTLTERKMERSVSPP